MRCCKIKLAMWRRIQTLYLALATIMCASMFFIRFATVYAADGEDTIMYYEMIPTAMLMISAISANGVAAFTYKNRILQVRVAGTASLVCLALQIYLLYHFFRADDSIVFSISMVFPAIAAILDFLAYRAIWRDEMAIFAASRLKGKERKQAD